jgi:hypothetical protein
VRRLRTGGAIGSSRKCCQPSLCTLTPRTRPKSSSRTRRCWNGTDAGGCRSVTTSGQLVAAIEAAYSERQARRRATTCSLTSRYWQMRHCSGRARVISGPGGGAGSSRTRSNADRRPARNCERCSDGAMCFCSSFSKLANRLNCEMKPQSERDRRTIQVYQARVKRGLVVNCVKRLSGKRLGGREQ